MENQNITLSIRKDLLLKVKLMAVRRNASVSGLLASTLEGLVRQEEAYAHAQERHLRQLDTAFDLGTGGDVMHSRDELHDRN